MGDWLNRIIRSLEIAPTLVEVPLDAAQQIIAEIAGIGSERQVTFDSAMPNFRAYLSQAAENGKCVFVNLRNWVDAKNWLPYINYSTYNNTMALIDKNVGYVSVHKDFRICVIAEKGLIPRQERFEGPIHEHWIYIPLI